MSAAWRQRAEREMERLRPPAQGVALLGLHRQGLRLVAAVEEGSAEEMEPPAIEPAGTAARVAPA